MMTLKLIWNLRRLTDGSRTNNMLSNLRGGTRAENVADMIAHGTWKAFGRIA